MLPSFGPCKRDITEPQKKMDVDGKQQVTETVTNHSRT